MANPQPPVPVMREWKPKCPELPVLSGYAENPPSSYWRSWPVNNVLAPQPRSWISSRAIRRLAEVTGYGRDSNIDWAVKVIESGALVGARGAARLGHDAKNYVSAIDHGHLLADALGDWIKKGLILGPFTYDDLPVTDPRVSPMSVVPKPSGHGRIVVDFSAPHVQNPDLEGSSPVSVNDGIKIEDFPCGGSSTKDVLKRLYLFGRGCTITKQDWSDAYKVLILAIIN